MTAKIVIDGENATMGRLASYSAKQALLGKEVIIVNVDKVIVVGKRANILSKYIRLMNIGGSSLKGPVIKKSPDRILKRAIRGMLPHKLGRGREAFKKIRCYNEVPEVLKESKKIRAGKEKRGKFISLKELSKLLRSNG